MVKLPKGKQMGRLLLLGTGVVILTPMIAQVIPPIFELGEIISVGVALSAGVAAFVTEWVLGAVLKM